MPNYSEPFNYTYNVKGYPYEIEFRKFFGLFLMKLHGTTLDDYIFVENNDIIGDLYITFLLFLDLKGIPITFLFEVKNDERATESGNIYIEYWSRGKKSGILATGSNYWAIKFVWDDVLKRNVYYIINRKRLLQACHDKRYFRDDVPGGDDYLNRGLLFKWEVIEEIVKEGIAAKDGSMILNCEEYI